MGELVRLSAVRTRSKVFLRTIREIVFYLLRTDNGNRSKVDLKVTVSGPRRRLPVRANARKSSRLPHQNFVNYSSRRTQKESGKRSKVKAPVSGARPEVLPRHYMKKEWRYLA